ncbi:ABC transporter ATP-binding protein [Bacillaceae bacterium S4-13-56]
MDSPIIEVKDLTKKYDEQYAVNHLSLSIQKGEIFGLLGPNGAGKSTTILMMLGLSEITSGSIRVCKIDPTRNPLQVKRRVGYLPDDLGFYQHMTGLQNLLFTADLNGIPRRVAEERAQELLRKVGLEEVAHKKTGKYSRGMKQRLGLADVLIKKPEVIILDEPTLGIDPEGVREFLKLIRQLNEQENLTILLSSHHLHQVQQVCDRVGIFVKGKLIAQGNVEDLAKQLFLEDTFVIHATVTPLSDDLLERIRSISGVNRVKMQSNYIEIYCQSDVAAEISKNIVESGASLHSISKKDYGLDEIYHRYFEGRDHSESA